VGQVAKYDPVVGSALTALRGIDAFRMRKETDGLSEKANKEAFAQVIRLGLGVGLIGMLEFLFEDEEGDSVIQGTKGKDFSSEQLLAERLGKENSFFGRDISQVDPVGGMLISYANARDSDSVPEYMDKQIETFLKRSLTNNMVRTLNSGVAKVFDQKLERRSDPTLGFNRAAEMLSGAPVRTSKDNEPIVDMFGDVVHKREAGALSAVSSAFGVKDFDDMKGDKRRWGLKLMELQKVTDGLEGVKGVIPGGVESVKGIENLTQYRKDVGERFFQLLNIIGDPDTIESDLRTIKRIQRASSEARKWAKRRN